ncbi:MAG TPA: NnrS family protein [Candidatus Limnocylindria bacterium]|nr:NnrS family protein [Candidatus Limnocylindria bacterium]
MISLFVLTALGIALTAGFGLGLWLLLARTLGLSTGELAWTALVQTHGTIQLFGFSAMFLMGVGMHVLPRFRGAPPTPRGLALVAYVATALAIALRAVAQPVPGFPARDLVLSAGGPLLVAGTATFALAAVRALRGGTNPHRPDELVMAAGVVAAPLAAILVAIGLAGRPVPLVIPQADDDRGVWAMLLGCLATTIFGVWARLAPGFVATPPAPPRALVGGAALWLAGTVLTVAGVAFASVLLLIGLLVIVRALGLFGATIARQPLVAHARLTRLAARSAFAWALVGAAMLFAYDVRAAAAGTAPAYLELSAVRHAFALGLVTLMIYGVAARALPSFLDRRPWSLRPQAVTIALANAGVALRVIPQMLGASDAIANVIVALSGVLAYLALVAFAANVIGLLRSPRVTQPPRGSPIPMAVRLR